MQTKLTKNTNLFQTKMDRLLQTENSYFVMLELALCCEHQKVPRWGNHTVFGNIVQLTIAQHRLVLETIWHFVLATGQFRKEIFPK